MNCFSNHVCILYHAVVRPVLIWFIVTCKRSEEPIPHTSVNLCDDSVWPAGGKNRESKFAEMVAKCDRHCCIVTGVGYMAFSRTSYALQVENWWDGRLYRHYLREKEILHESDRDVTNISKWTWNPSEISHYLR